MGEKVDETYMENLEEWILEESKVVTYKFLSRALKVHVNVAKQMLFNFHQKNSQTKLSVVYLISGSVDTDEGQTLKVVLVKDSDLDTVTKKFRKISSKHIYSLQKQSQDGSNSTTSTGLYATDLESFKEDVFAASSHVAIRNKKAVPRSSAELETLKKTHRPSKSEPASAAPQPKPSQPPKKPENLKEVKGKAGIESAFAKASQNAKKASQEVKQEKKKASAEKPKAAKKTGGIAGMFAKQASKQAAQKPEQLSSATSPGKENRENHQLESEAAGQKADSKESSAGRTKTKDDSSKKRKRIQVLDSESEEEEDQEEPADHRQEEVEEAPPQAKLIESDDDEIIPDTPKANSQRNSKSGRKRVRKLVDKTFMDEKGYMVTKKVYESGSETDDEPEPPKQEPKQEKKAVSPPSKKIKKTVAGGGNKQQNIMNFFKKK